jgi:apolipoprotein N-acyltransferase
MADVTAKNRLSVASITLSAVSGLLIVFSLAPHDNWWMAWFALVPFLYGLKGATLKQSAVYGLVLGSVTNFGAFHWLTVLMNDFSNLGVAAYLVMAVMALYQGVPYMLWSMFLRTSLPRKRSSLMTITVMFMSAISFTVFEFFYPIVFPWYLAVTQHTRPDFMGVVELAGTGLLSLAIVVVNLSLARLLLADGEDGKVWPVRLPKAGRIAVLVVGVLTLLFCRGFSVARNRQLAELTEQAEKLNLAVVQPNHWINSVEPLEGLHQYQRMTYDLVQQAEAAGRPLDLVLWPESAVRTPAPQHVSRRGPASPTEPSRYPLDLLTLLPSATPPARELMLERVAGWELLSVQRGYQTPILFGTTMQDMDPDAKGALPGGPALYNCGVLIDRTGSVAGVAPKVELLLFGETIPMSGAFPIIYKILPMASALVPGTEAVTIDFGGAKLGMMICYEDLLPWFHYELARKRPDVLLNLTNDAWFGKTPEAVSHLSLAKFRSVEGRVFLVRSTPSGVSAVVDATGAVVAEIPMDVSGTLTHPVALLQVETGWEKYGDSVVWTGLFLLLGFLLWKFRAPPRK